MAAAAMRRPRVRAAGRARDRLVIWRTGCRHCDAILSPASSLDAASSVPFDGPGWRRGELPRRQCRVQQSDFGTPLCNRRPCPRPSDHSGSGGVEIEAQDPNNHSHIDHWRYGIVTYLQLLSTNRLSGPDPVEPQLIDPDLEANLFDLDVIDFSAAPKLMGDAIKRAGLQDPATISRMEI